MRNSSDQILDATLKAAPPVAVSFYGTILAMPIEKWVAVLTVIYIALQVYLLVRDKIIRKRRKTDYVRRRRGTDIKTEQDQQ